MRLVISCFCLLLLFSFFYKFQTAVTPTVSASGEVDSVVPAASLSSKRLMIPSATDCFTGKTSTNVNSWRWEAGANVKVYFLQGSFTDTEILALSKAVNNWNDALQEINSDITFEIAGTTNKVVTIRNSLTVRRVGKMNDRLAEIQPFVQSKTLTRAEINVGATIKDFNALISMMNHEMGHSLGLSDCFDCKRGSTAMAAFRGKNKDNKAFSPSRCDKYVVAASYFINNFETTSALLNQFK